MVPSVAFLVGISSVGPFFILIFGRPRRSLFPTEAVESLEEQRNRRKTERRAFSHSVLHLVTRLAVHRKVTRLVGSLSRGLHYYLGVLTSASPCVIYITREESHCCFHCSIVLRPFVRRSTLGVFSNQSNCLTVKHVVRYHTTHHPLLFLCGRVAFYFCTVSTFAYSGSFRYNSAAFRSLLTQ